MSRRYVVTAPGFGSLHSVYVYRDESVGPAKRSTTRYWENCGEPAPFLGKGTNQLHAANKDAAAIVISEGRSISVMHWEESLDAVVVFRNAEWWV